MSHTAATAAPTVTSEFKTAYLGEIVDSFGEELNNMREEVDVDVGRLVGFIEAGAEFFSEEERALLAQDMGRS
jgi:hypothetical protein